MTIHSKIPEAAIQSEHVRTTIRQFPVAVGVHTINAVAVAGLHWLFTDASRAALVLWLAAIVLLGGARLLATHRYFKDAVSAKDWRKWSLVALFYSGMYGILWAVGIIAFLEIQEPISAILLVVIPMGLAAGSAATSAAIPIVFFAFLFTTVPTLAVVLLLTGEPVGITLAVLTLATSAADTAICMTIHNALDQSLRLRLENERLREEAERANHAKTRFLAAASHDLRQPIHALGLFFSALSERVRTEETAGLIGRIEATIQVIASMLNALLDVSKLDAGVVQPRIGPTRVDQLFARLEAEFAEMAKERGNRLKLRPVECWIESDPAMLERILRNLIANALRYTLDGRVLVAARRRGTSLWLEVWDTGEGIAADRLDEVFLEFQQIGNPERDRLQGLGLGLAIVRRLVRLLDHPIEVRSVPGKGSCFRVLVPLCVTEPAEDRPVAPGDGRSSSIRQSHLLVMVVDDDRSVREAMSDLLSGWGYQVLVVGSRDDALSAASTAAPDLIVVDYRLPGGITGADVIESVRTRAGSQVPAVLITGDTAPDRLREAVARGYPLLHKPVEPARLRSTLRYLAERRP